MRRLLLVAALLGGALGAQGRSLSFWRAFRDQSLEDRLEEAQSMAIQAIQAAHADYDTTVEVSESLGALSSAADRLARASDLADGYAEDAALAEEMGDDYELSEAQDLEAAAESDVEYARVQLEALIEKAKNLATMSLYRRLDPLPLASALGETSPRDVAHAFGASFGATRSAVRSRVGEAIGASPWVAGLLELGTIAVPAVGLVVAFTILRRHKRAAEGAEAQPEPPLRLRSEFLLLNHLYWAGYFLGLALSTLLMRGETPLLEFALAQPEEYSVYQSVVAVMFLCYLCALGRHAYVERLPSSLAQLLIAAVMFFVLYANITYPALVDSLPPNCGLPTFAALAATSSCLTALIRWERKGKAE